MIYMGTFPSFLIWFYFSPVSWDDGHWNPKGQEVILGLQKNKKENRNQMFLLKTWVLIPYHRLTVRNHVETHFLVITDMLHQEQISKGYICLFDITYCLQIASSFWPTPSSQSFAVPSVSPRDQVYGTQ